jgi:hypothetical protein
VLTTTNDNTATPHAAAPALAPNARQRSGLPLAAGGAKGGWVMRCPHRLLCAGHSSADRWVGGSCHGRRCEALIKSVGKMQPKQCCHARRAPARDTASRCPAQPHHDTTPPGFTRNAGQNHNPTPKSTPGTRQCHGHKYAVRSIYIAGTRDRPSLKTHPGSTEITRAPGTQLVGSWPACALTGPAGG